MVIDTETETAVLSQNRTVPRRSFIVPDFTALTRGYCYLWKLLICFAE